MVHLDDRPAIDRLLDDTHDECEEEIQRLEEEWADEVIELKAAHQERLNEKGGEVYRAHQRIRALENEELRDEMRVQAERSETA